MALSGSVAKVVAERAAMPLGAVNISGWVPGPLQRFDQPVSKSLMVSFSVVVSQIFAGSVVYFASGFCGLWQPVQRWRSGCGETLMSFFAAGAWHARQSA